MRKFILIFTLMVNSLAFGQEDVPYQMLGIWSNMEGELLTVNRNLDDIVFVRKSRTQIKATGSIELNDGQLRIYRKDKQDEYDLAFFIGNETMVITKPRSPRAWIWFRIQ